MTTALTAMPMKMTMSAARLRGDGIDGRYPESGEFLAKFYPMTADPSIGPDRNCMIFAEDKNG